ncbi:hypothetical protein L6248_00755 [Candidatus Parcubacteria bacterium]|nr:hypothetical protein [Candidatus Parcubacteria bacterium]MCG2701325.1 hypothetical protein [Candidatus Parcubacteria bacterium]
MDPEKFKQFNSEDVKFNELKEKFNIWLRKDLMGNNEITAKFADRIQKEYADHYDYLLYHALTGSGIGSQCSKFDFPGDDSVEKFIEERYNNLNNN